MMNVMGKLHAKAMGNVRTNNSLTVIVVDRIHAKSYNVELVGINMTRSDG